ncbi:hypothetical protein VTJ49DRAFT_3283 [Mycothermus thermophilus]|uniref:BRCT domain-containing protein n=1 Tax=Humicola insolens TaxID=85995 RepID=A0ABR3V7U8_HUMIN
MPSPKPKLPPPPEPRYSRTFDPWNSVSTGHQIAEGRRPQGWRESRSLNMNSQFAAGNSGGQRISDTIGFGSKDFDENLGLFLPKEIRARTRTSVADMLRKPGTMRAVSRPSSSSSALSAPRADQLGSDSRGQGKHRAEEAYSDTTAPDPPPVSAEEAKASQASHIANRTTQPRERKIFDGLVIYVNGSTHPLVSDHKLKHLLSENGARVALHLGRRQVTHVILGKPAGPSGNGSGGAGGGLAGGKLEREIRRVGGCGVKFVGVEWALESIKAGKRLPEARFANLKIAARAQRSVLGAFSKGDGSTQQPPVATTSPDI